MKACREENRKVEEVTKANGGKMGSCSRIKDRNGRLSLGEDEIRKIDIPRNWLQSTCVAFMEFSDKKN